MYLISYYILHLFFMTIKLPPHVGYKHVFDGKQNFSNINKAVGQILLNSRHDKYVLSFLLLFQCQGLSDCDLADTSQVSHAKGYSVVSRFMCKACGPTIYVSVQGRTKSFFLSYVRPYRFFKHQLKCGSPPSPFLTDMCLVCILFLDAQIRDPRSKKKC